MYETIGFSQPLTLEYPQLNFVSTQVGLVRFVLISLATSITMWAYRVCTLYKVYC